MSLEDDIKGIFKTASEKREKEQRDRREFEERWSELRDQVVRPILERALTALKELGVGGTCRRFNGGVELLLGPPSASRYDRLAFDVHPTDQVIQCQSSAREIEQLFTMEFIVDAIIEKKIREFVRRIAAAS